MLKLHLIGGCLQYVFFPPTEPPIGEEDAFFPKTEPPIGKEDAFFPPTEPPIEKRMHFFRQLNCQQEERMHFPANRRGGCIFPANTTSQSSGLPVGLSFSALLPRYMELRQWRERDRFPGTVYFEEERSPRMSTISGKRRRQCKQENGIEGGNVHRKRNARLEQTNKMIEKMEYR